MSGGAQMSTFGREADEEWERQRQAKVVPFRNGQAGQPHINQSQLVSECASEIMLQPVEWLWQGRIAKGKHTCIAGEPGSGKSQLSMFITATVTMGGLWPCGEGRAKLGSVVVLSAEDGPADTILPRLHAAGADCGRVQIIKAVKEGEHRRGFNLQRDLLLLEKECDRLGDVSLIIMDPVSSYLGKTDSHKNAEVRSVLEPIGEFADRLGIAVLSITHFSKSGAGSATKALHRFIGSIAFVGAPRVALAVIEEDGRYLLLHAKNNLSAPPAGLAYKVQSHVLEPSMIETSRVVFDGAHVAVSADEAIQKDRGWKSPERDSAAEFLQELLSKGPMKQVDVEDAVEGSFHSWRTIRRAAEQLGVTKKKDGMAGGWVWRLPTS
jgi:RecA-family ATPase